MGNNLIQAAGNILVIAFSPAMPKAIVFIAEMGTIPAVSAAALFQPSGGVP
jgi:hypothetical protein